MPSSEKKKLLACFATQTVLGDVAAHVTIDWGNELFLFNIIIYIARLKSRKSDDCGPEDDKVSLTTHERKKYKE
jgi:hypothetical protein